MVCHLRCLRICILLLLPSVRSYDYEIDEAGIPILWEPQKGLLFSPDGDKKTLGEMSDSLQHPRLAAKLRKRLDVESRSVPQAELEPRRRDAEETDLGEGPESDEVLTKSWRVLQDFSNAKLQRSKVRVFIFFR